ncbi:MAG: hypothetical protein KIS76_14345 [Pyrinomonadaceae bacterium]|nr:hypothetical protein [Pyrinomonadaceae bacterium]
MEETIFMQAILDQKSIAENVLNRTNGAFGKKIGIFSSVFGCWHKRLTRPFTNRNSSYRACLDCGARRKFDTESLRTYGSFYFPPTISFDNN